MFSLAPSAVLIFCGIYIPFESYILHLLGVEGIWAILIKLGSELLLYITFAIALLMRLSQSRFRRSPIDLYIIAMFAVAFVSIILYSAAWDAAINNMRALFRYLAVFYLVYHFGFAMSAWKRLNKLLVVVIAINVFFSMAQYGLGNSYPSVLKVTEKVRISLDENPEIQQIIKDEKIGAVQGLQESPGVFGAFVVISVAMLLAKAYSFPQKNSNRLIKLLLVSLLISSFMTYSKTGFLLSVFTVVAFYYFFDPRLRKLIFTSLLILFVTALFTFTVVSSSIYQSVAKKEEISATKNLSNIFSSDYWDHFFAAERGWVIKEVGTQLFISFPIVGYSPDPDTAKEKIAESSDGKLARLVTYVAFEDVYWVALLGYYGFAGIILFIIIFLTLYQYGKSLLIYARTQGHSDVVALSSAFLALLSVLIPYCFFERVLEINVFSFYFWLMAGMVVRMQQSYAVQLRLQV